MPKLVQINVTANRGSTGVIAEEIGAMAIKNGWESWIIYGREPHGESKSNLIRVGTDIDMVAHGIESRLLDNHGLSSRRATRRLVEQLKSINPDVVQLHNIHGYFINYQILFEYFKKSNVHVVWTFHDCWPITGHCTHFMNVGCSKWKTQCGDCILRSGYPASLLLDQSARNFDVKSKIFTSIIDKLTIVACCDAIIDYIKQSYMKDARICKIANGIDIDIFKPQNVKKKKIILGVAGSWSERKGINEFRKLREKLPAEYQILLVGLTNRQIENLSEGILGIKRTADRTELAKLYTEARCLVNLTFADTFPTVNLESLACGTPVITYNTGGSPEALDSDTGIVVEQGNIEAVVDAIKLIGSKDPENCRRRATNLFNKNDRYRDYLDLYKSIL